MGSLDGFSESIKSKLKALATKFHSRSESIRDGAPQNKPVPFYTPEFVPRQGLNAQAWTGPVHILVGHCVGRQAHVTDPSTLHGGLLHNLNSTE